MQANRAKDHATSSNVLQAPLSTLSFADHDTRSYFRSRRRTVPDVHVASSSTDRSVPHLTQRRAAHTVAPAGPIPTPCDQILTCTAFRFIPPELFDPILEHICSTGKGGLGSCALVCKHWASRCRPALFREITLCCAQDVHEMMPLVKSSSSPIRSWVRITHHG